MPIRPVPHGDDVLGQIVVSGDGEELPRDEGVGLVFVAGCLLQDLFDFGEEILDAGGGVFGGDGGVLGGGHPGGLEFGGVNACQPGGDGEEAVGVVLGMRHRGLVDGEITA